MLNNLLRKSVNEFEGILKFPSLAQLELKKEKRRKLVYICGREIGVGLDWKPMDGLGLNKVR